MLDMVERVGVADVIRKVRGRYLSSIMGDKEVELLDQRSLFTVSPVPRNTYCIDTVR